MAQDQISYYIGPSKASCALMEQVERLAKSDTTVLVVGEPGSGKNMIVRELHARSPRAGEPLVEVSLAALSPSLVESELFGHVRGAFTGAVSSRKGLFEEANGGTFESGLTMDRAIRRAEGRKSEKDIQKLRYWIELRDRRR